MILIDTHIWLWWTLEPNKLSLAQRASLSENEADIIGVSAISCWEVAKLAQLGKIQLNHSTSDWISTALQYPGVQLLPLTPAIAISSTQLPDGLRSDPADEILVATALTYDCLFVTSDRKLRDYKHVKTV